MTGAIAGARFALMIALPLGDADNAASDTANSTMTAALNNLALLIGRMIFVFMLVVF
jgi:hypothetical protein